MLKTYDKKRVNLIVPIGDREMHLQGGTDEHLGRVVCIRIDGPLNARLGRPMFDVEREVHAGLPRDCHQTS